MPLRAGVIPGLQTGMDSSASSNTLRRATTNIYRSLGANLKRKSVCATLKAQMVGSLGGRFLDYPGVLRVHIVRI